MTPSAGINVTLKAVFAVARRHGGDAVNQEHAASRGQTWIASRSTAMIWTTAGVRKA